MKWISGLFTFLIFIFLLNTFPHAARADVTFVTGKYNRGILVNQEGMCHDYVCPACMYNNFPDLMNPFCVSSGGNEYCEGIEAWANPWYHWRSDGGWESFALFFTTRAVVKETISHCLQDYFTDVHCTWTDPDDQTVYDITGAYNLGSELKLGILDSFIDRFSTGWPTGPNSYEWTDLRIYVMDAMNNLGAEGLGSWELTFYASLAYYVDSMLETIPAEPGGPRVKSTSMLDSDFAAKCTAHALVCWQGSEWENGRQYFDLLTPSGIEEFPFAREDCPTFVFQMEEALADLLYLPVESQNLSFGTVKAQYR